jgi:hypothetical protein
MLSKRRTKTAEARIPDDVLKTVEEQLAMNVGGIGAAIRGAAIPDKFKAWARFNQPLKAALKSRALKVCSFRRSDACSLLVVG